MYLIVIKCIFNLLCFIRGDESREERGELLAAQVDIPSEETPKEEKDGTGSAASTPKPSAECVYMLSHLKAFSHSKISEHSCTQKKVSMVTNLIICVIHSKLQITKILLNFHTK